MDEKDEEEIIQLMLAEEHSQIKKTFQTLKSYTMFGANDILVFSNGSGFLCNLYSVAAYPPYRSI